MVYNDLMINNTSVSDYNINRSLPVTIQCPITWVGAPVDRRRQTGMLCPNRALISVRIIVPFFRMASRPLSAAHQLMLTPVAAIVALRSTFEAMFLTPEARPASEGPVFSSRFLITTVGLACPSVIIMAPSPGGKLLGSALPVFFLAALHSDRPNCLVYLL